MIELPKIQIVNRFSWIIPGEPMGTQRHRARVNYNRGRAFAQTYDTAENRSMKHLIRDYLFASGFKESLRHEGPVRFTIMIVKSRPKRLMRRHDPDGLVFCTSKPDWDNCGKMVSDALNTICYTDDAQVCDSRVFKFFHEKVGRPRTEIIMEFLW